MTDPYAVLGVSRNATQDEIKKAYRQKAKQYHPDLHPDDPEAAKKMNEVNEAYDLLQHPEKMRAQQAQQSRQSSSGSYSSSYGGANSQSGYGSYNPYGSSGGYSYGNRYGSGGYSSSGSTNGYSGNRYTYNSGDSGWSTNFYGFDFADLFGFGSYNTADTTPRPQSGDPSALVQAITYINQGRYQDAINTLAGMTGNTRNARWYYVAACAYYGTGDRSRAMDLIQKAITMDPGNSVYQALYNKYSRAESAQSYGFSRSAGSDSSNGYSNSTTVVRMPSFFRILLGFFAIRFIFRLLGTLFFRF